MSYGYVSLVPLKIPTKSDQLHVRFEAGIPARLTKLAAELGQRRTEWMRSTVFWRVERLLDQKLSMSPLSCPTPADGLGEGIVLRLRPADLKRLERAAEEEGALPSTYVRAICMEALEASCLAPDAIGGPRIKKRRKVDPMYVAGSAREAARARKERR